MKRFFKITKSFVWTIILLFLGLIVVTFLPIKGNYKVYTVQSGSMEPSIHLGSLIFVKSLGDYNVGDIVTRTTSDPKVTITHRIVSKKAEGGQTVFETKGDANDSADGESLNQNQIIGKVFFQLPFVGYPIGYARSIQGFILLVIVPAVVIVYEELRKIKEEMMNKFRKKKEVKIPIADNYFEEKFVRSSKIDNFGSVVFESKEASLKEKEKVGRKMDL